MISRVTLPWILLLALSLHGCGPSAPGVDTGPLPKIRYEVEPDNTRVALVDVPAVAQWCRDRALPQPPPIDRAEPAVAEALYAALTAAADQGTAESFGQVGGIAESVDAHRSAIAYFGLAAEKDGRDFRWPYFRGCAHQALGEDELAIQALEHARSLDPTYPTLYARLGQLYLDQGRREEASDAFHKYAEMEPDDGFGPLGLGRLALLEGDLEEAQRRLIAAAQIRANDFQVQHQLGRLYTALGDRERAQVHFAAAAKLPQGAWFLLRDPLLQDLEASIGSAASLIREFERLSETRDWPTLTRLAEEISSRRPNDATMLLNLASLYRAQGRFDEAHEALDRALEIRPGNLRLLATRAEIYLAEGEFERSLEAAQTVLDLQPGLLRGLVVRGRALLMLERYAEAETDLQLVAEETPDSPSNLFTLAEVLRLQGKSSEAIAVYQRVLELQPGNPNVEKILQQMGADS